MNQEPDDNLRKDFNAASASRVAALLDRLRRIPDGRAIVDFLEEQSVEIDLQDDPVNWAASTLTITGIRDGIYSYKDPVIILKNDLSDDNMLQAIVHESQHLRQHLSGVGNPDRILSEAQYILFYRAAEADAQAACTWIAWKLKEAGDEGPWKEAGRVGYQDICDAFAATVAGDPAALDDGRARRAAFDAWFANDARLAGYNKATVDHMIPFLQTGRNIFSGHGMTEGALDAGWLHKLNAAAREPYLLRDGGRDLLSDGYFSRDAERHSPEPRNKVPANNSLQPPKAA